jgi:hypothetical protein
MSETVRSKDLDADTDAPLPLTAALRLARLTAPFRTRRELYGAPSP